VLKGEYWEVTVRYPDLGPCTFFIDPIRLARSPNARPATSGPPAARQQLGPQIRLVRRPGREMLPV
jgi:hypothetical protein